MRPARRRLRRRQSRPRRRPAPARHQGPARASRTGRRAGGRAARQAVRRRWIRQQRQQRQAAQQRPGRLVRETQRQACTQSVRAQGASASAHLQQPKHGQDARHVRGRLAQQQRLRPRAREPAGCPAAVWQAAVCGGSRRSSVDGSPSLARAGGWRLQCRLLHQHQPLVNTPPPTTPPPAAAASSCFLAKQRLVRAPKAMHTPAQHALVNTAHRHDAAPHLLPPRRPASWPGMCWSP